ncbi:MAG: hypothetical protein AAFR31_05790 [Cyanobacteria bacterium J06627_8]
MKHYSDKWVQDWCCENGWTDPVMEPLNHYWAFPPGAVMPQPIPVDTLRFLKSQNGMTSQEKAWSATAIAVSFVMAVLSYVLKCPMPLVAGFAFVAFVVAGLEVDDL